MKESLLLMLGICIGFGIRPLYVVISGQDIPCLPPSPKQRKEFARFCKRILLCAVPAHVAAAWFFMYTDVFLGLGVWLMVFRVTWMIANRNHVDKRKDGH